MLNSIRDFLKQRVLRGLVRRLNNLKIAAMAGEVARRETTANPSTGSGQRRQPPTSNLQPVVFFKASTGIDDLSWNSAFHLLASWGLRLQGVPVVYFACQSGMSHCVLGTNRENVRKAPPCESCVYQSRTLYTAVPTSNLQPSTALHWFTYDRDPTLAAALTNLDLARLLRFTFHGLPLGALCLPGLRWILRVHHLTDDEDTRFLYREYILSAWSVAQKFSKFLDEVQPRAVVVFNGQFYPEAVARHVAHSRGLRVVTHEVGLQPASAYFTDGEATAYPIHIPADFELSAEQNARLDAYLQKRFQGDFTMAGIQFWPDMQGLDQGFLARAAQFKQIVPVFTNVIFDTSQPHANTVFSDMFAWLDMTLQVMRAHPETLFVIRAHPDETRTRKESRETVQGWAEANRVDRMHNVVFVAPKESLSSYELIQRSKFVMVYNSTIGLEASLMGKPVLCAGKARFTQYPTVFFPQTVEEQRGKMKEFLAAAQIEIPPEFQRNARRFLYYQLFRTSLPFGDFLQPSIRTTQARLKSFDPRALVRSPAIRAVTSGILNGGDFLLEESSHRT